MNRKDITVGSTYQAKVNGRVVPVRVTRIRPDSGPKQNLTYYDVVNTVTGRSTTFRSAAKFRSASPIPAARMTEGEPPPQVITITPGDTLCPRCGAPVRVEDGLYAYHRHPSKGVTCGYSGERVTGGEQRPDPTSVPAPQAPAPSTPEPTSSTESPRSVEAVPAPETSGLAARLASRAAAEDDAPHLIVEARAGTGKTTTLVAGLQVLMGEEPTNAAGKPITPSPQQKAVWDAIALSRGKVKSVCFVAFNKSIADELSARVPKGCDAMTMHRMGFKAVRKAFKLRPGRDAVTDGDGRVKNIIAELLGLSLREAWKQKPTVLRATVELVNLCKMNLIHVEREVESGSYGRSTEVRESHTPTEFAHELDRLASHYEVELNGCREEVYALVPRVLERCKDVSRDGQVDFADMIWLPVVLNLPVTRYDLLLVDEAQDLNRCQQALAKKAGRRLVLCGDPKQAIYGFAGADCESMPRMAKELGDSEYAQHTDGDRAGKTGRGCITLPLTVTRRCGKAIVAEARKIVPDFEAHESNPEGTISRYTYNEERMPTEGNPLYPPGHCAGGYAAVVRDGDFLLCRVNAPLVSQCFRFLKAGRKAVILGRDVAKGLTDLVKKLSGGDNRDEDVPRFLQNLEAWHGGEIGKEQAKTNPSEGKLIALADRVDCLHCFADGAATVTALLAKIEAVFTDNRDSPGIRLSSIHKAKGLEARRVFLLEPERATVPHPMAKCEWQLEQEWNLRYVAITRAIEELVYVS